MLLWLKKKQLLSLLAVKIYYAEFTFFTLPVQWEYLRRGLKSVLSERDEQSTEKETSCMNGWQALAAN